MLRSCQYCGRIHDTKIDCGKKPKRKKKITDADRFRRTKVWTNKSIEIRQRDKYLCQACIRKLPGTDMQYNHSGLSVHHAEPVEKAWDKRLDNDNLLSLCDTHHRMAERGEIPLGQIKKIIRQQEAAA